MAICGHLDILSAVRFASTCKTIRAAVKGAVDGREELLPKRVALALVASLQQHLKIEREMPTTLLFDVTPVQVNMGGSTRRSTPFTCRTKPTAEQ